MRHLGAFLKPLLQWKMSKYSIFLVSVVLVIYHAMRMCRIIFLPVACSAVPNVSTLALKQHDFRKTVIENKVRVLIFSKTFI